MAVNPPSRGQRDWDDELNTALQALDAAAEQAKANAAAAVSTANAARNRADEVHTAVVGGADAVTAGFAADRTSETGKVLASSFAAPLMLVGPGIDPTGATDSSPAIQAKINAASVGITARLPAGTYRLDSALTIPNYMTIEGEGRASQINFMGAGTFVTLASQTQVKFRNLRVRLTSPTAVAFDLSNSFRCSWTGCIIEGQHTSATGSTYRTQYGFKLRDNAGDNRIIDCDLNNLGVGVRTDTIQNYLTGCVFGTNWRGVWGGDPTGTAFVAGIAMANCTMVGGAGASTGVDAHVYVEGSANTWWLTNVWMEKCDTAIKVGAAAGGPTGFFLDHLKVAAHTSCITLTSVKQASLRDIVFAPDTGYTPTELTINPAVTDGVASNLISGSGFEVPLSTFPNGWTYMPRSNTESSKVAGRSLDIGAGIAAGQISYFQAGGGRARVGYDGTNTILSDAGGNREVRLRAGSTPLDGVRVSNLGVAFNGTAPVAKPMVTGSRGGNAALASLLTALANLGLITDSTTA